MNDDDSINIRIRSYVQPRYRVTIGDTMFEFPEGTTREEAQSVLDEAKRRYLKLRLVP